jgi:hypothetical protein
MSSSIQAGQLMQKFQSAVNSGSIIFQRNVILDTLFLLPQLVANIKTGVTKLATYLPNAVGEIPTCTNKELQSAFGQLNTIQTDVQNCVQSG